MKVRIIGSGSMWNAYNSASYMIDDNILIDIPNGMCKYLFKLGVDPCKINNILITHFHGDHYFDIPFYFLLKSRTGDKKINIFCSKEGKRKNNKLLKLAFPNSSKEVKKNIILNYEYKDSFLVNDYNVTKILVNHGRMKPAYGYIFSKNNIKFGFTGDTTLCKSVEYMASICNYLFCDCMFIEGTSKHMGIDMIKDLCYKYPKCQFIVSHMEDNTRKEIEKLNIRNLIVPNDGLIINIK